MQRYNNIANCVQEAGAFGNVAVPNRFLHRIDD